MGDFKDLAIWQKAHELTLHIYRATASFPQRELYGLTSQLCRAAVSVEANLAEGTGRKGDPELVRFTNIARGSIAEIECLLLIARDLGYLQSSDYEKLADEADHVARLLTRFSNAVKSTAAGKA